VLLAHLQQPAPDLRDFVPDVPDELAVLCLRAMAKNPDDRYRSAERMGAALRHCIEVVDARSSAGRCSHCGGRLRGQDTFCGACGGVVGEHLVTPTPSGEIAFPQAEDPRLPFVGREGMARHLVDAVADSSAQAWMHVRGQHGEGKSRLLFEVCERAREAGHAVVRATPHPLDAPAPYHVTRELLCRALGVSSSAMRQWLEEGRSFGSALVHAGISGVLTASGIRGVPWADRVGAACAALESALSDLGRTRPEGRLLIVVDDLHRCDSLSLRVLQALVRRGNFEGLLLTAGRLDAPPVATSFPLKPLHEEDLALLCEHLHLTKEARAVASHAGTEVGRPLYVEQLARSRSARNAIASEAAPARLTDLVATRITAMQPEIRDVLFSVAVLGDRCRRDDLFAVHGEEVAPALNALRSGGLLRVLEHQVAFVHPLLRDVALASIPDELRQTLHERALRAAEARGAELPERAVHAYGANSPAALLWLDRLGFEAVRRGDPETAVFAYERAVNLSRRRAMRIGDEANLAATRILQRGLAEALRHTGDIRAAEGVLLEARTHVGPLDPEHLELGCHLAILQAEGARLDEARATLAELADAQDASRSATLWTARAAVARREGNFAIAAEASRMALASHVANGADDVTRIRALVVLADDLLTTNDENASRAALEQASARCVAEEHPALTSMVLGRLARLAKNSGRPIVASDLFREAARLAAEGGDEPQHTSWRCEADDISQVG
jgi:tetratricopeptide (TPR) repeat protein